MSDEVESSSWEESSDLSIGNGVDKTREEYLSQFARPSPSPQCEPHFTSPVSGFYSMAHSSTSLIMLNRRFRNSRIRETTLWEESSKILDGDEENEHFLLNKEIHLKSSTSFEKNEITPRISVDPRRHFENQTKIFHKRRCTSSTSTEHPETKSTVKLLQHRHFQKKQKSPNSIRQRSISALNKNLSVLPENSIETSWTKSFLPSVPNLGEKSKPLELDFDQYSMKFNRKLSPRNNGKTTKISLRNDQKLFLLAKSRIYDTKPVQTRRLSSFTESLQNRFLNETRCKPKFRLTEPENLPKYKSFTPPCRSVNFSSFSMRSDDFRRLNDDRNVISSVELHLPTFKVNSSTKNGKFLENLNTVQV